MTDIGLDIRMIENTGIGTYLRGLLTGFHQQKQMPRFTLFGKKNHSGKDSSRAFESPIYSLREQLAYPRFLAQCKLWHSPHYNIPYFKGKTKLVVTVHDLIHWVYRDQFFTPLQKFYAGAMFQRVVATADHIIAVSQKTKDDLIQYFAASPKKISVIYEGIGSQHEPQEHPAARFQQPYFLYVGSIKPHKNILTLIRTYKHLRAQNKLKASLVLVGKKDKVYPESQKELEHLEKIDGIIYCPEVTSLELPNIYRRALGLIHPSFYEGFGLTLLEAMAAGTPVLSSNAASLPEVGGDAAAFFDPHDTESLGKLMIRLETDSAWRNELCQKGFQNIKKFSWHKTAQQTLEVYEKVLNS